MFDENFCSLLILPRNPSHCLNSFSHIFEVTSPVAKSASLMFIYPERRNGLIEHKILCANLLAVESEISRLGRPLECRPPSHLPPSNIHVEPGQLLALRIQHCPYTMVLGLTTYGTPRPAAARTSAAICRSFASPFCVKKETNCFCLRTGSKLRLIASLCKQTGQSCIGAWSDSS